MQIRRDRSALYFSDRPRYGNRGRWIFMTWFVLMAVVLGAIWQWNSVEARVNTWVNGPPTITPNAVELAQLADEAYWEGDLLMSIRYYEQAASLEPNNMAIMFEYVRNLIYYSYTGRGFDQYAERALEVSTRAVQTNPNNPYAKAAYAFALVSTERGDEAAVAALDAIDLAPNWAEPRAYLSLAYQEQQRWRIAQEVGQEAVNLNPNSVDSRRALALSMAYTGDFDITINQFEQAIQVHPKLDALYFEVALYYTALDNYEAAIQSFDRVLAHDSRNVKAWTRKCETFFRQREDGSAQESCEQAIELDPTYPDAHKQLGMVRYTRRNYEGAIESFNTCIDLMKAQNWNPQDYLAECYVINGLSQYILANCSAAMDLFTTALTIDTSQRMQELTQEGMILCANSDPSISIQDLPTPAPQPTIPPEPIGIY